MSDEYYSDAYVAQLLRGVEAELGLRVRLHHSAMMGGYQIRVTREPVKPKTFLETDRYEHRGGAMHHLRMWMEHWLEEYGVDPARADKILQRPVV